jgi:hypothetical protein
MHKTGALLQLTCPEKNQVGIVCFTILSVGPGKRRRASRRAALMDRLASRAGLGQTLPRECAEADRRGGDQ